MGILKNIKGVGEHLEKEIINAYGSEERALKELKSLNFAELFYSDIKTSRMQEIAREIYSEALNFDYVDIFGNPKAREIYSAILNAIKEEAVTPYAKIKVGLFAPVRHREEIERRHVTVRVAMSLVSSLGDRVTETKEALRMIKPFQKKSEGRIASQVIAVEDKELYNQLKDKYSSFIEIFLIESPEDFKYLRNYELVRYIQGDIGVTVNLLSGNFLTFYEFNESEVLPEIVIKGITENLDSIKAIKKIAELIEGLNIKELDIELMKSEVLEKIISILESLDSTQVKVFSEARDRLNQEVDERLRLANREIEERVEGAVALKGREVLKLLSGFQAGGAYEVIPEKVKEIIKDVAEKSEVEVANSLCLEKERIMFSGLFSYGYPLEISEEKLQETSAWLEAEATRREFRAARDAASEIESYMKEVERSVNAVLELDFYLAIGSFALKYKATLPKVSESPSLTFIEAMHLGLALEGKAEPVSYSVGISSIKLEGSGGERIAIITGANSGGKTTLLETIAQVQIAAQSGLPVLAEKAEFSILEKIYYFAKPQGTVSAGAFETLLRFFSDMAEKSEKSLILADELESVTEPGAAARVLSAFIEWFAPRKDILLVMVTHLGEELMEVVKGKARIDGIEASGLDENLNLIVSRNPILGKPAKSTPELIVEKLSRKEDKPFYEFLLKKFRAS